LQMMAMNGLNCKAIGIGESLVAWNGCNYSENIRTTRVYAQTHVYEISVFKGFQWVLYNATH